MSIRISAWLLLSFFALAGLQAKDPPRRPVPPRLVNDYAGMLTPAEASALESKLVAYNDSTSTQIAIVIEPTIEGDDVFDYSLRLAASWGVGQKGKDNGILIFIALQDRKLYIQTGYGAEGFLPDALAKRIIETVIKPAFREGQYYAGLNEATTIIMKLGAGEFTADQLGNSADQDGFPWMTIIIIIVLIVILSGWIGKNNRHHHDDDDDGGYWRGGRYDVGPRSGGWMVFPGGGGGGGGFGGGGFGGFGGGGFGGGGAGGSW